MSDFTRRRISLYVDDLTDKSSDEYLWVLDWLDRWKTKISIAYYSTGGWEHYWDIEAPEEAAKEIPEHFFCSSEWSSSQAIRQ